MDPVLIIAEAGVNHNGEITLAKKLIDAAAEAGVDFVKFQTFKATKLVSKNAEKAEYQKRNTKGEDENQFAMLKKLELSHDDHLTLIDYCDMKGVNFLSSAFDTEGLDYLDSLGLPVFKVPSGEITNYPYLKRLAEIGKPVILSTGMADLKEIEEAIEVLLSGVLTKEMITVLHCNTEYPTPLEHVNLRAMNTIEQALKVDVGYSDHTMGIEVPVASVAMGARVIEKHFTLDRNMPGPDHRASLEPAELKQMVTSIRNIEKAVSGSGNKIPSPSEQKNMAVARKSIIAVADIQAGEVFTEDNIGVKRPGNGINPMKWQSVLGSVSKQSYKADQLIDQKELGND